MMCVARALAVIPHEPDAQKTRPRASARAISERQALLHLVERLPPDLGPMVVACTDSGLYAGGLERMQEYAGFAHVIGEDLCLSMGGSPDCAAGCGKFAALVRVFMQYFDVVFDDFGTLAERQREIFSQEALERALVPRRTPIDAFECRPDDAAVVRIVTGLGNHAFREIQGLGYASRDGLGRRAFSHFCELIRDTYTGELWVSREPVASTADLEHAERMRRAAASLPMSALALGVVLRSGRPDAWPLMESVGRSLADAFWLLDDVLDLYDDLTDEAWNAVVLLAARERGPGILEWVCRADPEVAMAWLIQHGFVDRVAERAAECALEAHRAVERGFGRTPLADDLHWLLSSRLTRSSAGSP